MPPLILNTNFIKWESKIGHAQDSSWGSPDWQSADITTNWEPAEWESHYWKPEVQLLKLCKCSQIPLPSPRVASSSNGTKTKHHWLSIYKHSTSTKFCHLARNKTEGKLSNPWSNTRKSRTHLFSLHSLDQQQKQKDKTFDSLSVLIFISYTRNKKKNPSPRKIRLTLVTNSWAVAYKSWMERCSPRAPGFQLNNTSNISQLFLISSRHNRVDRLSKS